MGVTKSADPRKEALLSRLKAIGQEHLVAFWDQLTASERETLAEQIDRIDAELFRKLQEEHRQQASAGDDAGSKWAELAARAQPPNAMRLNGSGVSFSSEDAREAGRAALQAGQVGMILVAGGLGTRLGFEQPKGMFPIGPLSGRSLFQVLIEQLLAVSRRHGTRIPLYVMTSPATDAATRTFLRENKNFGLAADDLHIFSQATMWAVSSDFSRILLESPGSLFLGPDGHGGMLTAFDRTGGAGGRRTARHQAPVLRPDRQSAVAGVRRAADRQPHPGGQRGDDTGRA